MREPNVTTFDQANRLRLLAAYWQSHVANGRLPGTGIVMSLMGTFDHVHPSRRRIKGFR